MNRTDALAQQKQCTYAQFPDFFVWQPAKKRWKIRLRGHSVGRLVTAHPTEGERYYMRLLLTEVRGPRSYADLRTVNGHEHSTFHAVALDRGLLIHNNSQDECMTEAATYHMPAALRKLYADLLIHSCPTDPTALWSKFEGAMSADYTHMSNLTVRMVRNKVLQQINNYLVGMGKSLRHFNIIPDPVTDFEVAVPDAGRELVIEHSITVDPNDLASEHLLNTEQKLAFNAIVDSLFSDSPKALFIDGPGGTGKTFLYRALLAHVRSKGAIALATATSGIAASLLPGGRTAHSRFKIPIELDESSTCKISKQSSLARLIKETKLILWDEAPMAIRTAVESLDKLLKDLMGCQADFGGKVVVLGGDFRQTLPVVAKGTKNETINASLIKSPLWPKLIHMRLNMNMRARLDPEFTHFLLKIGSGLEQSTTTSLLSLPPQICFKATPNIQDPWQEFVSTIYPDLHALARGDLPFANRAILTTKNCFVDEINETIIHKFPGTETEYIAYNETDDVSDQGVYEDMLNSLTPNGLPPHRLILKINCPIILLRNIDPSEGLCNGTRMICRAFSKNVIQAEIAMGDFAGKHVFIPRIPLSPGKGDFSPIPYKRRQFPVRLCFAMTINKSQGQTLDFVGVYLKEHVFSHGQLYVALSRSRTSANVKVFIQPLSTIPYLDNETRNVVYKEVLTL